MKKLFLGLVCIMMLSGCSTIHMNGNDDATKVELQAIQKKIVVHEKVIKEMQNIIGLIIQELQKKSSGQVPANGI